MQFVIVMLSNSFPFNPEILPSNSGKPADHHKLIVGSIIALVAMAIIGVVYWWVVQSREVSDLVPDTNNAGQVLLTSEQSQVKREVIANTSSEQVKLTPEDKKKKEALLKSMQEI